MGISGEETLTPLAGNGLSDAQKRFIELERKKEDVKKYFTDLKTACEAVYAEIGFNTMFQDAEGTVYQIVEPEGRFVEFDRIGYERTRRTGEKQGSLSLTKAREAGFVVE